MAQTDPRINPEAKEQLQRFFRQLTLLFTVFLMGLLVVLVGVLVGNNFGQDPTNPEADRLMQWAVPFLALAQLLLSQFVYNSRIKRGRDEDKLYKKMDAFKSGMLLRFIVMNSAAILACIAFLMTGSWIFIGLAVIVGGVMFFYRPTTPRFIQDLQLSKIEQQVVEDHMAA